LKQASHLVIVRLADERTAEVAGLSKRVDRREKTRKRRYVERIQRRKEQRRLQAQVDAAIRQAIRQAYEQVLRDEVTALLGRALSERRDLDDPTVVGARCNKCGACYRREFSRDGTYKRSVLSLEAWVEIRVPRLTCNCGGVVDFEFVHLEPYNRFWFDLEERGRELAGLCVSLRDSVEVLAWRSGQPISIATLNKRVNQTAELTEAFHKGQFECVPTVVMLDGVWLKVLIPTDEEYLDKRGRRRKRQKLRRFPLLVAYGVDPNSGQRWVLDWERGEDEDQASWQKLLERLLERGLTVERGLKLFVHDGSAGLDKAFEVVWFGEGVERQRCVFHKLRNVGRDVVGDEGMTAKERRKRRGEVLKDAAQVYRGENEAEIRRRLAGFRAKWAEKEPKAVATLERDFDQTLAYLKVLERARTRGEAWRVECLRTTSPLERVQRQFRQKQRQLLISHSERGVDAAIELVIRHRGLALSSRAAEPWTQLLEEALLAA
jgi:transposase-like protein